MKQRLLALDVLRGLTIGGMILVNSPGTWSYYRAVVRRRLQRSKIGFSKSFPFSRHDIAPNVGIGRLADSGRSPTTPRAAARNNIRSYLGYFSNTKTRLRPPSANN